MRRLIGRAVLWLIWPAVLEMVEELGREMQDREDSFEAKARVVIDGALDRMGRA